MKTLVRAPWGVVRDGEMVREVGVCVEGDKIIGWGRADDFCEGDYDECVELSGCVLSPGWINVHAHLDYGFLRGKLRGGNFVKWIDEVVRAKAEVDERDVVKSLETGAAEAFWSGTTTMLSVISFPDCIGEADMGALQVVWAVEWIDARKPVLWSDLEATMERWMRMGREKKQWGISPHAPYSASRELYGMCKRWAEERGAVLTTHVGESEAEWSLFEKGEGELAVWLHERGLGKINKRCSPLGYIMSQGGLPRGALCVHGNYMDEKDWDVVAAGEMVVVHCPRSHNFFEHRDFDWGACRRREIVVCIGTDGLASAPSLDLRGELRSLSQRWEKRGWGLKMEEGALWRMVTVEAAKALGMEARRGVIDAGAMADLVAFPLRNEDDPWSFIFGEGLPVKWLMVGGEIHER